MPSRARGGVESLSDIPILASRRLPTSGRGEHGQSSVRVRTLSRIRPRDLVPCHRHRRAFDRRDDGPVGGEDAKENHICASPRIAGPLRSHELAPGGPRRRAPLPRSPLVRSRGDAVVHADNGIRRHVAPSRWPSSSRSSTAATAPSRPPTPRPARRSVRGSLMSDSAARALRLHPLAYVRSYAGRRSGSGWQLLQRPSSPSPSARARGESSEGPRMIEVHEASPAQVLSTSRMGAKDTGRSTRTSST